MPINQRQISGLIDSLAGKLNVPSGTPDGTKFLNDANTYVNINIRNIVKSVTIVTDIITLDKTHHIVKVIVPDAIVTLPDATVELLDFIIKNGSTGNIYILAINDQTIDDEPTPLMLQPKASLFIQSDGSNWMVL